MLLGELRLESGDDEAAAAALALAQRAAEAKARAVAYAQQRAKVGAGTPEDVREQIAASRRLVVRYKVATALLVGIQVRGEALGGTDDDNVDFWVGDGADCAKRKLKKAFCEPENVAFNPPLDLAKFLVAAKLLPALEIARSPENGGDKAYGAADLAAMTADFASGALHPGDLKPAVVAGLQATLLKPAADGGGDAPDAKKDAAALKALAKKLAKMKK